MNRRMAREQAFLLVFEKTFHDESLPELIEAAQLARDLEIDPFAERIFRGIECEPQPIEELIEQNIIGWKKSRLSRVALALLRVAVYEMRSEEDIPISVSINEAVELAKKYGSKDDAPFINGVLGSIAKKLEAGK